MNLDLFFSLGLWVAQGSVPAHYQACFSWWMSIIILGKVRLSGGPIRIFCSLKPSAPGPDGPDWSCFRSFVDFFQAPECNWGLCPSISWSGGSPELFTMMFLALLFLQCGPRSFLVSWEIREGPVNPLIFPALSQGAWGIVLEILYAILRHYFSSSIRFGLFSSIFWFGSKQGKCSRTFLGPFNFFWMNVHSLFWAFYGTQRT